jgi:hypothetical protein
VHRRAGLDDLEKRKFLTLSGLELQPLRRPVRGQSLYRLHYPGSLGREVGSALKRRVLENKSPRHTPHFRVARVEGWRSSMASVRLTNASYVYADEDDTI